MEDDYFDKASGSIGFGKSYGVTSYNGRPIDLERVRAEKTEAINVAMKAALESAAETLKMAREDVRPFFYKAIDATLAQIDELIQADETK